MADSILRRTLMNFRRNNTTTQPEAPEPRKFVRLPTFWKAMIITSFALNLILIFVVVLFGTFMLTWRNQIGTTAVGVQGFARDNIQELRDVVQQLRASTIRTTIPIDQPLPLKGSGVVVPVDQTTTVILVEPVPLALADADIDLGNGNRLRANNINLVLPAGTPLTIALKMDIPLDSVTIPIVLNVPVTIPLKDTELGPQFQRLGNVVDRLVGPASGILDIEVPPAPPPQLPKK